jgi:hypothetical protein
MVNKDDERNLSAHDQNSEVGFVFSSVELEQRSQKIKEILEKKKKGIQERTLEEANSEDQRIKDLQARLEADERYKQIQEMLQHPDFEVLLGETQEHVDSFAKNPQPEYELHTELSEWQGRMRRSWGLEDSKWESLHSMGEVHAWDKDIEGRLYGTVGKSLISQFPSDYRPSPAWSIAITVRWDMETQKLAMSYLDTTLGKVIEIKDFDHLIELTAETLSRPPIFHKRELDNWEELYGRQGKMYEAFGVFNEIYRQSGRGTIYGFFEAKEKGIYDELTRIVSTIHAQLEPVRLLRQIASNTRSISNSSAYTAAGTTAIAQLSAQNNAALEAVSRQIQALGRGR